MKREVEIIEIKNKKGSMTVYVVILFSSLIILVTFLISLAKGMLAVSGAYSMGNVWASSILGEYDVELYRRYGIFGFMGDEAEVSSKLQYLSDYSFRNKNYASVSITGVDLYEYSLMERKNFMEQIKTVCVTDFIEEMSSDDMSFDMAYQGGSLEEIEGNHLGEATIGRLPSYGKTGGLNLETAKETLRRISSLEGILTEGTDAFFINKYIGHNFRNVYFSGLEDETFFKGEQEYIISGRNSDEANRKAARNKIIALREVMNLIYIEQDESMSEAALAAGEVVTLGYAGPEAAHLIMAAWALAESVNDYELLQRGYPVPMMKSPESWAIDLDSVLENEEQGCVYTGNQNGDNYTEYLMYLLYLTGDNTKILRMMDLMELNLRTTYSSDFRISECDVGVNYTMNVNGKSYEFKEEY